MTEKTNRAETSDPERLSAGAARAPQDARGQRDYRRQQAEDALQRDPDDPERQHEQPHERIEDEREQRERPADDEEQKPHQEGRHACWYAARSGRFSGRLAYQVVIPKSGPCLSSRGATARRGIPFPCHPEERQRRGIPFGKITKRGIPRFARDDIT